MDPKLARGHVRAEMRALKKAPLLAQDIAGILDPLGDDIYLRRRVDQTRIKLAMNAVAKAMGDHPTIIRATRHGSGKTLSRAKFFDSASAMTLYVHPDSGDAILETIHAKATLTEVSTTFTTPPVQFVAHALERYLERDGNSDEAAWNVANEVIRSIGLLSLFVLPGTHLPERSLALPIGDGLLLGNVVDTFHGRSTDGHAFAMLRTIDRRGYGEQSIGPAFFTDPMTDHAWVFLAKTYIGPKEINSRQQAFIDRCRALTATHGPLIDVIGIGGTDAASDEYADTCNATSPHAPAIDAICEAAIDIVMEPLMARAMGNSAPPAIRPERVTAYYQRRHEERLKVGAPVHALIAKSLQGSRP